MGDSTKLKYTTTRRALLSALQLHGRFHETKKIQLFYAILSSRHSRARRALHPALQLHGRRRSVGRGALALSPGRESAGLDGLVAGDDLLMYTLTVQLFMIHYVYSTSARARSGGRRPRCPRGWRRFIHVYSSTQRYIIHDFYTPLCILHYVHR